MRPVLFIDTSVLCNIVPVPGMDQEVESIKGELKKFLQEGVQFILPITSVIETGNHIAHLPDGGRRRMVAEKFADILNFVLEGKAPWVLHDVPWNAAFLEELLATADTGCTYVEHAVAERGAGDLCILTERAAYERRTGIRATVWSIDKDLIAYKD